MTIPAAEKNGFVKTLNNMGYMTSTLDSVSCSFVGFAAKTQGIVLDVGAAYGVASVAAISTGARVLVNDLDPAHLNLLEDQLSEEQRKRLHKLPGNFFDIDIENGSLDAILACRVLHFLNGESLEKAAALFASWLKPKGRVFIVCETPYLKNFKDYIPVYEQKIAAGHPWPGYIDDVMKIAPERGASLPPTIHFLDPQVLARVFEAAGFKTLLVSTMKRTDFPEDLQLDGRESVGYVGEK